jgi:hypothetical protein
VRNLSSCVKVALDFVSPENAHRCVTLTNQFAKLPRGHHLSEDKLQVKTMLLHAMKHIAAALEPRTSAASCTPCAAESEEAEAAEAAARAMGEAMAEEACSSLLPASGVGPQVESPSMSPEGGGVSAVSAQPEREERVEVEREEEAGVEEPLVVVEEEEEEEALVVVVDEVEEEAAAGATAVEVEPQDVEPQEAAAAREVAQEREAVLVLSLSATDTACP